MIEKEDNPLKVLVMAMIFAGSVLMVYNIWGFMRFSKVVQKNKEQQKMERILRLPIILLILFLIGYILVGLFGHPDLIVAGILFGGSIFVFVMYRMLDEVTKHIMENERLEAELMASEQSRKTKERFLATMSHEMRTPMNVILGLDGLALKNPENPPETQEALEKIGHSARHMVGLIDNILKMNELNAEEPSGRSESFQLKDAVDQVNVITNTVSEEKGVHYESRLEPDAEGEYLGDEIQLKQVLLSILDNAVKYTPPGGMVRFTASCDSCTDDQAVLKFVISDNGIGIDPEFLPHIYDPFAREDDSATDRYGGSGLSLAVSKNMVERMGGTIEVSSRKNEGTEFTVTVPVKRIKIERIPEPVMEVSLAGRRILIAEDVKENAEIVADLLELEDAESEHAENGQIAVEMFRNSSVGYYDVILMDLRMPVMDGLEATRRIRALDRPDAKTVPIIALTANSFESDKKQTKEAGMNEHLGKPADAELLYATIRKWLQPS